MSSPLGQRWLVVLIALLCLLLRPAAARAQTPDEQLARAKALFREGNALLQAGDPERALERFLESRALVPSGKNTANAAICLERMGRNDEALELYEELFTRFAADIDEQDREKLMPIMASLRAGLASLEISANVEGSITVDGKPRGRLPRVTALRVLPGKRRIRLTHEGYQSFDGVVESVAGKTLSVDASLEPLAGTGAARVEVTGGASGRVWIDGKPVGETPWEGTLKPGVHRLQIVGDQLGSKLEKLEVLAGKTLLVRVRVSKLGPPLQLRVEPKTARIELDDELLGPGEWSGRLPVGAYVLKSAEPGYFPDDRPLIVSDGAEPQSLRIVLTRDPEHARWPHRLPLRLGAGIQLGLGYAPSLSGGAEASCPSLCARSQAAIGGKFELLGEVVHDSGFGAELGLGYLMAHQSFSRAATGQYSGNEVTYALGHELVMGGAYLRLSAMAALALGKAFTLRPALGVGAVNAHYEARSDGVAWTTSQPVAVSGSGLDPMSALEPVITSALAVERRFGSVHISLGVGVWFFPFKGPKFSSAVLAPAPGSCSADELDAVGCAPSPGFFADEAVHGPFGLVSPELAARYRF